MDPLQMEKAMINNMVSKTGKHIEQWIGIVQEKDFQKHGEIVRFLKEKYSLTHGYANLIAHKSR